jgi:soluble lytic murein transglycosylase-like protein
MDLLFKRSRRRAAAKRKAPRRRGPLHRRSVWAVVLAIVLLTVAAESTGLGSKRLLARDQPAPALDAKCPVPARFRQAFAAAAAKTGVPVALLVATAYEESGMDPSARSSAGARGLLQLMPGTARELQLEVDDPAANVLAGARYLRQLLDRFGRVDLALAAYNAGPTAVLRAGGMAPSVATLRYAQNVQARAASLVSCR